MIRSIKTNVLTLIFGMAIISGCQSPSEKVNEAKEDVQDAKEELQEVKADANQDAIRKANEEEWQRYRTDSEMQIKANEDFIADLKAQMKKTGKKMNEANEKAIAEIEEQNNALKTRVNAYVLNDSDWEEFKREFNHDAEQLGNALKGITVNNKK